VNQKKDTRREHEKQWADEKSQMEVKIASDAIQSCHDVGISFYTAQGRTSRRPDR